ncbi:MAG: hypothetical protein WC718_07850 [Phycisphaerales bacterium]|jgi:hypothetical protein
MNKIWSKMVRSLAAMACVLAATAIFSITPGAQASDKITLKDGKVIEGSIVREVDGYLWVKYAIGGIDHEQMFRPDEISSIDRDAPAADPAKIDGSPASAPDGTAPKMVKDGVPRATVITLGSRETDQGDTVGIYMTAHALDEMVPLLKEELGDDGSGVVVFRVTSGGGLLLEIERISDEIQNVYKKNFRTVAWIDSAISAAAMSSHCIEEIYFTPQGNYGACTGWSGALVAVKGRGLEEVLYLMQRISARGGYDKLIMRSMQIQQPLSATIDANGEVKWYNDATSGEILVNRDNEILTFNAETAKRVKFSKGTASNIEELRKLMGYQELNWVGKQVKGTPWPVSKAEEWNIAYRKQVHKDEEHVQQYFRSYNLQIQAAMAEQTKEGRGKFVNQARQTLQRLRDACRTNPNFGLLQLNVTNEKDLRDFFEAQEKRLRDLLR